MATTDMPIKGMTLAKIEVRRGDKTYDDFIRFITNDGNTYLMAHSQDCCEHVSIEDIAGDLLDLIGNPLVMAEEVSNTDSFPERKDLEKGEESFTWTFYKFATVKGYVTIRWFGSSNGYYSESVAFDKEESIGFRVEGVSK